MTPLWTLQTHKAPAAVTLTEDALVLKNAYITRTIDRRSGVTVSITDGDGTEALAAPLSGSFDNVAVPGFGSWPPVYPKNLENLLSPAEPAEDSGIRMALYEHDLPENTMFVLAHMGLHTTYDTAVAEDELWLLDGWKR